MLVIADSMILIHLAKITLLEATCDLFKQILIPVAVYRETVVEGKKKGYNDAYLINQLIKERKIKIEGVSRVSIRKLNRFNIQGGEAEAIALYQQMEADLIASDDDNVRNKKHLLKLNLVGTPSILYSLFSAKIIDKPKLKRSIDELRKIGWFSNAILDKVLMEVDKNE